MKEENKQEKKLELQTLKKISLPKTIQPAPLKLLNLKPKVEELDNFKGLKKSSLQEQQWAKLAIQLAIQLAKKKLTSSLHNAKKGSLLKPSSPLRIKPQKTKKKSRLHTSYFIPQGETL